MRLQIIKQERNKLKSPFEFVIYKIKNQQNYIIEDQTSNRVALISNSELQNYFVVDNITTNWRALFDRERFIRIDRDQPLYFLPLFEEDFRYFNFKFILSSIANDYDNDVINELKRKTLNVDNFRIYEDQEFHNYNVLLARLPVYKLYCIVTLNQKFPSGYMKTAIAMRQNETFYNFPYGNVSGDNNVCFGNQNNMMKDFKQDITERFLFYFVTTVFNHDYGFQLRSGQNLSGKHITFDLDKIEQSIKNSNFQEIHKVDILFYLSQTPIEKIYTSLFLETTNEDFLTINKMMKGQESCI